MMIPDILKNVLGLKETRLRHQRLKKGGDSVTTWRPSHRTRVEDPLLHRHTNSWGPNGESHGGSLDYQRVTWHPRTCQSTPNLMSNS